jgi:uncharacterized protein
MTVIVPYTKDNMKRVKYDRVKIKGYILNILRDIQQDGFKPDVIVGINRGGLPAAVKISHYLDVPLVPLCKDESNLWLAEDAFAGKNILIVDDINDTGSTIANIKKDWPSGCHPSNPKWDNVFGYNVRFAVLIDNDASDELVSYAGHTINKAENPEWCVFPWEEWWAE